MAKFEYEVLVGIDYPPNNRAEAGDIVSDLPKDSIAWLLDSDIIKVVASKKPTISKPVTEIEVDDEL